MNLNKDSHTIGKDSMNTIAETLHIFSKKKKTSANAEDLYSLQRVPSKSFFSFRYKLY